MQVIIDFFNNHQIWSVILDGYLLFLAIGLILYFMFSSKRIFFLILSLGIMLGIEYLASSLNLQISEYVYKILILVFIVVIGVTLATELKSRSFNNKVIKKRTESTDDSKNALCEAAFELASKNIGALITIERYNSLEEFASKAIKLDSDISKELLINIFIPDTPLHDGAVIIRGNKIRCAGAYFELTEHNVSKTTGSRHRAGIGITEATDAFSIIVSEETGHVSAAYAGNRIPVESEEELMNLLDTMFDRKGGLADAD